MNIPRVNIGLIGHVAHGKTSLVKALTSIKTVKFKKELENNITIKLGYADAIIYKLEDSSYISRGLNQNSSGQGLLHISFIDCPGHESLMSTMIGGTCLMDGVILLIAANEKCPMPQTIEHLKIIEILNIKNIIIVQNKIDLVSRYDAIQNYKSICSFIKGTIAENSPIIPISANLNIGISSLCKYIINKYSENINTEIIKNPEIIKNTEIIKNPENKENLYFIIIRSFDINKPGSTIDELLGGVVGGSVVSGRLNKNRIEIRPGIIYKKNINNKLVFTYTPIYANVVSIYSEKIDIEYADKSGLVGVGLDIDPSITKSNNLVGHVIGDVGTLPEVYSKISITFYMCSLVKKELILVNIGSFRTEAIVSKINNNKAILELMIPICCKLESKVLLSKKNTNNWRLNGYGIINDGLIIEKN